jgi:hypothetical protein
MGGSIIGVIVGVMGGKEGRVGGNGGKRWVGGELGINIHGVGRKRSQRWLGLLSGGHGSIVFWGEGTFLKGVGVSYEEALGNAACSSGHAGGLG